MTKLTEQITKYQKSYYEGNPLITDQEYDALVANHPEAELYIGTGGDVDHLNPMYSLRKYYPSRGDTIPPTDLYYKSIKLDGAGVELVYSRCYDTNLFTLSRLVTRGDTDTGSQLNHKKHSCLGVPSSFFAESVDSSVQDIQITGEVVATKDVPNARNLASGALNTKDFAQFADSANLLGLQFYAYNLLGGGSVLLNDTFPQDLRALSGYGFKTIESVSELLSTKPMGFLESTPENISTKPMLKIATDGIVYRLIDNRQFMELGFTAKFPRGAFAVKEDADFIVTTLLDVEWNVGRTGKVVPTAILEEVNIAGAKVARATLNNPSFISAMGLYIGCKVKVIRSGEIIPCIIGLYE